MVLIERARFGVRAVRVPGQAWRAAGHVVPAAGGGGARQLVLQPRPAQARGRGRRRLRRGGYLTCDAAAAARNRLSVPAPGDPGGVLLVTGWLETWVEARARLRGSTRRIYRSHVRLHFRLVLDGVLLGELHVGHVQEAFRRLLDEGMTPATARRLFSTLRSALNAAVRERLIPDNPARSNA